MATLYQKLKNWVPIQQWLPLADGAIIYVKSLNPLLGAAWPYRMTTSIG